MTEFLYNEPLGFPLLASLAGPTEVAVVGAGISGLACANLLVAQGFKVRVFDEGRAPGGRIATSREDDWEFDSGAQYFTVRHPAFEEKVGAWVKAGLVSEWKGKIRVVEGGEIRDVASPTTRFVGVPSMSSIAWALGESLDIQTQVEIRQLVRRGGSWYLESRDGDRFGPFDVAILALPAPLAAALLPPAPHLAGRATEVKMRPAWAVMVGFETSLDLPYDGAFVHASPLSWIARNDSKPGRGSRSCWVLHAAHEWSEEHLDASPGSVVETLCQVFEELTAQELPPRRFAAAHLWSFSEAEDLLRDRCLFDPQLGIGACGDWCGGRRVEGAFLSGHALALRIIERWMGGGREGGGGVGVA